ncbi:MAG: alpha/beta fold hydrolase [Candidatus Binataceae bacterium]
MPAVSLGAFRIDYADRSGAGIPILFLHGLGCGYRMWQRQLRAFAGRRRVLALDFPAHGGSSAPNDPALYNEETFADTAIDLLDYLGVQRVVLSGLSMGGGIALTLALMYPNRVAGLLIADTGSGSDDPAGYNILSLERARILRERGLEAYAEATMASPNLHSYVQRGAWMRRHMRLLLMRNNPAGLARVLEGIQAARPAMQDRPLGRIRAPSTVLVGALDHACLGSSRYAAEAIPGARYVELPGAGHLSALEAPAAFNAALSELLGRVAADRLRPEV